MLSAPKWPSLPRIGARAAGWTVLVVIAILLVATVPKALFVVFAGVLLAVFLETVAAPIARHTRLPYPAAVALIVLLGIASVVVAAILVGPSLAEQASRLAEELPRAFRSVLDGARRWLGGAGVQAVPKPSELKPEAHSFVTGATGALAGSVELLAGFVVIAFVGVYGALSPDAYVSAALRLVPPERRPRYAQMLHEAGHRLGRWLAGRVVAMAFVGVATTIGLALLGVPLAVLLGIVAGLLAFVEYLGAVVSAVPPMLLALTNRPIDALWVALLFTGVHVVEGYLLTPLLARRAVHFPPAFTLVAQTIFGAVFGVVGLTFATPVCIVAATFVETLYVEDSLGERPRR